MKDYINLISRPVEVEPIRWHWYEFFAGSAIVMLAVLIIHSL